VGRPAAELIGERCALRWRQHRHRRSRQLLDAFVAVVRPDERRRVEGVAAERLEHLGVLASPRLRGSTALRLEVRADLFSLSRREVECPAEPSPRSALVPRTAVAIVLRTAPATLTGVLAVRLDEPIDELPALGGRQDGVKLVQCSAIDAGPDVGRALLGGKAGGKSLRLDRGTLDLLRERREKLSVCGPDRNAGSVALLLELLDGGALVDGERVQLQGSPEQTAAFAMVAMMTVGVAPGVGRIGSECDGAWHEGQRTDERRRQQGVADPSVHDFSLNLRTDRRATSPRESLRAGKEA
jgi:hypothetical protein